VVNTVKVEDGKWMGHNTDSGGILSVLSGAWAQELELMSDALRSRLDATVGENRITSLRFTADLSRHR